MIFTRASILFRLIAFIEDQEGVAGMGKKKPLEPSDFPVSTDARKVVTQDGKPIADAGSEPLAEDVAERLNEDAARKEEDRWAF